MTRSRGQAGQRSGDVEAFARRFGPVITRVARGRLSDPDLVDEATSAVLLRHRQLAGAVADSADPEPLIVRATINACTDVLRRHRRWATTVTPYGPEELGRLSDAPDVTADPEQSLLAAERVEAIADALRTVKDAELLLLRAVDGYSYDELASLTGRSATALRSAYARARRKAAAAYAAILEQRGLLGAIFRRSRRCADLARRCVPRPSYADALAALLQRAELAAVLAIGAAGLFGPPGAAASAVTHVSSTRAADGPAAAPGTPSAGSRPATPTRSGATGLSATTTRSSSSPRLAAAVNQGVVRAAGTVDDGGGTAPSTVGFRVQSPVGGDAITQNTDVPCWWVIANGNARRELCQN